MAEDVKKLRKFNRVLMRQLKRRRREKSGRSIKETLREIREQSRSAIEQRGRERDPQPEKRETKKMSEFADRVCGEALTELLGELNVKLGPDDSSKKEALSNKLKTLTMTQ